MHEVGIIAAILVDLSEGLGRGMQKASDKSKVLLRVKYAVEMESYCRLVRLR